MRKILILFASLLFVGGVVGADASNSGSELIEAASAGKSKLVLKLIATGADVNAQDNDGFTALGFAKNRKIIKMLKKAGAR